MRTYRALASSSANVPAAITNIGEHEELARIAVAITVVVPMPPVGAATVGCLRTPPRSEAPDEPTNGRTVAGVPVERAVDARGKSRPDRTGRWHRLRSRHPSSVLRRDRGGPGPVGELRAGRGAGVGRLRVEPACAGDRTHAVQRSRHIRRLRPMAGVLRPMPPLFSR